jgi:hypothetical protein
LRGDRTCCDSDGRASLVLVEELLPVLRRLPLVLDLGRHGRGAGASHSCNFVRPRPYIEAASAAVVGDPVAHAAIGNAAVVNVADTWVDAVDGAVVVEVISVPITAVIAQPGVTETVVDAAVEPDIATPVAAVKAVTSAIEAPVAGRPESAIVRRSAPRAGYPVVAAGAPAPVAGRPQIVGVWSLGLIINGQRRGRLVGVFVGLAGVGVELVVVLGVLGRWIALVGRRGLLLGVLLGTLLNRGL